MKFGNAKSLLNLTCGVVFAVIILLSLGGQSHAFSVTCGTQATCPYIKVYGGDAMAGGWFGSNCAAVSGLYQSYNSGAVSPNPQTSDYGGILTYAKSGGTSAAGGSSSQYGAFSLGAISGLSASDYGFYSGANGSGGSVSRLSFANNVAGSWGGDFEGGGTGGNCIPDYYTAKQNSPANLGTQSSQPLGNLTGPQYAVTAASPSMTLTGNLPTSSTINTTLFVKGNVYIGSDIKYPTTYTATTVPKFALVVQGNIYIAPGVDEIDGLYIAEPSSLTSDSGDGVIWTCHDGTNSTQVDATTLIAGGVCHKTRLDVEGALIAKQINFFRTVGDVTLPAASVAEDNPSNGLSSSNISEIINYTPAMVIGGPFFNASASSSSTPIDNLVSLPPVF